MAHEVGAGLLDEAFDIEPSVRELHTKLPRQISATERLLGVYEAKTSMNRQLTDDDAFVLAACMANRLAIETATIAPDETQILIAHLDRI